MEEDEAQDSECPVCYENLLDSARTLSCGHAFCHDCLVRTLVSVSREGALTRDSIVCPVCRHLTFITKLQGLVGRAGEKEQKILEVPSTFVARPGSGTGERLRWIRPCVRWVLSRLGRQRLVCPKDSLQVFIISDMGRPMAEDDVIDVGTNVGVQENTGGVGGGGHGWTVCTTSHCLLILLIAFTVLALVAATLPWVLLA
ncbi:RING finger protein 222 [Astyanax mexicanus]|uniref:Ring finger protein 222 n=2 Tax=Astyanax mexicanus TaxID=7994 RepID=A0A3B1KH40_ASTMX|nr:RING finger protein 222 [Astyanax mexicanus]KAG9264349.1 RING finger protein 222 [Astyanax mexicanus]